MLALLGVLVVLTLALLALSILVAALMAEKLSTAAAVVNLAVFGFLIVLLLVLIVVNAFLLQSSMVFAVTTQGLTLAPPYRRARFVPWAQVAAIEPSQGPLMRGAVMVASRTAPA